MDKYEIIDKIIKIKDKHDNDCDDYDCDVYDVLESLLNQLKDICPKCKKQRFVRAKLGDDFKEKYIFKCESCGYEEIKK